MAAIRAYAADNDYELVAHYETSTLPAFSSTTAPASRRP
jgi:hypothetical protein